MLLRLLLTLLLSIVAIPASAAMPCHDAGSTTVAMTMPGHHSPAPVRDDMPAAHFCTGCVPPSAMLATRIMPPALLPAVPPIARVAQLDLGGSDPPSLPPPRLT
jgi:hypothetical protein